MRSLRLLPIALLLALPLASRAQVADLYLTFSLAHVGTGPVTTTQVAGITDIYTPAKSSFNAFGGTVGGTINFIDGKRQQLGVDLRETIAPANGGAYLSLAGIRYSAFARKSHIRPYVELAGGGVIETNPYTDTTVITTGFTTRTVNPTPGFTGHGAFAGLVGVDARIKSNLSFRAEFGGGHVGHSINGDGPDGGALVLFSTGVVFHFD